MESSHLLAENSERWQLHSQDEKLDVQTRVESRSTVTKAVLGVSLVIVAILTVFRPTIDSAISKAHEPPADDVRPCGNTSQQAISRGCTFEALTWTWRPSDCPPSLEDEFLIAAGREPWRYWDSLGQHFFVSPRDQDFLEVIHSGKQLWGERREHVTHCVYLLLSAAKALHDKTSGLKILHDFEHMEHCAAMITANLRADNDWEKVEVEVPKPKFNSQCIR